MDIDSNLKGCLSKAIAIFNKTNEQSKIVESTSYYRIRLAKKSGLPDNDLPGNITFILIYSNSRKFDAETIKLYKFFNNDRRLTRHCPPIPQIRSQC